MYMLTNYGSFSKVNIIDKDLMSITNRSVVYLRIIKSHHNMVFVIFIEFHSISINLVNEKI